MNASRTSHHRQPDNGGSNDGMKSKNSTNSRCSNCGKKLEASWNVCPGCGTSMQVRRPSYPANSSTANSHRSDIDVQLDGMLEELVIIKKYREINSGYTIKAILPALIINLIVAHLITSGMAEDCVSYTYCGNTYDEEYDAYFASNYFLLYLPTLFALSGIAAIMGGSFLKGSLLRARSLIKSMDEMLPYSPGYSKRAEYVIAKSGIEQAFQARVVLGVFALITAIVAILLIFLSTQDNRRRY